MSEGAEAEVILAEVGGRAWLVRGEQHIDKLLNNTLSPDISIQVVSCESKSAVDRLWAEYNVGDGSDMWMIHPAIVERARGKPANSAVIFPAWSAAIDKDGQRAVELAVAAATARPETTLALVRNLPESADRSADDLAGLRCTLIEGRLTEAGLPAERMRRETRPAEAPEDVERIHLLLR